MSEAAAHGERVHFEARAASVPGAKAILAIAGALAIFAVGIEQPLLLGTCGVLCGSVLLSGRVVVRVREAAIEHRPIAGRRVRVKSPGLMSVSSRFGLVRIAADEMDRLGWDGFDNTGIRLRDGSVEAVQFRHLVRPEDQEPARGAILAFIGRATGKPLPAPPEPPLDVAPWVVRKPPHPLA